MSKLVLEKYKVFYKEYESPITLQAWLDKMYREEHLILVTMSENYFVFCNSQPPESETK